MDCQLVRKVDENKIYIGDYRYERLKTMTFEKLSSIIKEHNIPHDVILLSDSGWECDETEILGIYYNREINAMIFTQLNKPSCLCNGAKGFELIYSES